MVGCSLTNVAIGPDDTYMMRQAITTAAIMIVKSCAMPMAVMMESSENTMSMTMICAITQRKAPAPDVGWPSSSPASTSA